MAGNCILVNLLGVLLVLTIFHNPANVSADRGEGIPAVGLFTFGDSYFDAGNKMFLSKDKNPPQSMWPYGKSRDDPNGKFSDGHIVPDFIAEFMGIPQEIPPVFKPGVDVSRGASFAVADASILGSPAESKYEFKLDGRFHREVTIYDLHWYRRLLKLLPIARQEYKTGNECYEPLNDLAKQHNEKIGPMLNDIAQKSPGFQFTVFDFYNAVLRRTRRSPNYRLYVSNASCCGVGTHDAYGCGMGNVRSKLCEYQRAYFFFDGRHNTEKAQEEFAHLIFGADANVVQPMTLRELIVYPSNQPMREYWEPFLHHHFCLRTTKSFPSFHQFVVYKLQL